MRPSLHAKVFASANYMSEVNTVSLVLHGVQAVAGLGHGYMHEEFSNDEEDGEGR